LILATALTAMAFRFQDFNPQSPTAAIPSPTPDPKYKNRLPAVFATLTRFGFQPAAIRVPEGKSLLVVRNISGIETIQLELSEVRGSRLVTERPGEGKPFWEKPLNLKEGEYTLSVTENPRWTLALTVFSPQKK
jgi:hypothetical protein